MAIARICPEGFPPENPLPERSSGQDAFSILGHRARFAIATGLIGISVIIGLVLTKSSQPSPQQPVAKQTVNDYSWLSQRTVTDADLEGKSGFELDVMRNSIFARHGRRFDTTGLQQYFDKQPWYRPLYSPKDFPTSLLSSTEQWNVQYIAQYQDRYNRRYFQK